MALIGWINFLNTYLKESNEPSIISHLGCTVTSLVAAQKTSIIKNLPYCMCKE